MSLVNFRIQHAFILLWVILITGVIGASAISFSVWIWIETQRVQLQYEETQVRFAGQAILRQVLAELQDLLGPDTRIAQIDQVGQITVWDSSRWDPLNPKCSSDLAIGSLGMPKQNSVAMQKISFDGANYEYYYCYSLSPGWDILPETHDLPPPKRVLANVREGGLCKALDQQTGWKDSDALLCNTDKSKAVFFIGPTQGQIESFLAQASDLFITPQASVQDPASQVLPRLSQNHKYYSNAKVQRPKHMARYLRPIKINLDCFLEVAGIQKVNDSQFKLDLQIKAQAQVTAMNPYDNNMQQAHYFLQLDKPSMLDGLFHINVKNAGTFTPQLSDTADSALLWEWAFNYPLTNPFTKTSQASNNFVKLFARSNDFIGLDMVLAFPQMIKIDPINIKKCLWKLGENKENACELESLDEVTLYWYPQEVVSKGISVECLINDFKDGIKLGTFSTEPIFFEAPEQLGLQVWAPSTYYAAHSNSQNKARWLLNSIDLPKSLQIPTFTKLKPRSVMDVIHWGEWNPYQWAQGMPFTAIRPAICPSTEYVWQARQNTKAQLLDVAWIMGETLLDKYYLSTQAGLDHQCVGWTDYCLNVNDANPKRWERILGELLNNEQAVELSQACVEVLKQRGPFMGISDFVNRRLVDSIQSDHGAFEQACTMVGLTQNIQMDLLANLIPLLNAREDAWTVDIEIKIQNNKNKELVQYKKLRAWVQRSINHGSTPSNLANDLSSIDDGSSRKWYVVATKWL